MLLGLHDGIQIMLTLNLNVVGISILYFTVELFFYNSLLVFLCKSMDILVYFL